MLSLVLQLNTKHLAADQSGDQQAAKVSLFPVPERGVSPLQDRPQQAQPHLPAVSCQNDEVIKHFHGIPQIMTVVKCVFPKVYNVYYFLTLTTEFIF